LAAIIGPPLDAFAAGDADAGADADADADAADGVAPYAAPATGAVARHAVRARTAATDRTLSESGAASARRIVRTGHLQSQSRLPVEASL
jgi:hypothetical protein